MTNPTKDLKGNQPKDRAQELLSVFCLDILAEHGTEVDYAPDVKEYPCICGKMVVTQAVNENALRIIFIQHMMEVAVTKRESELRKESDQQMALVREAACLEVCHLCRSDTENLVDAGEEGWFHEIDYTEPDTGFGAHEHTEPEPCMATNIRSFSPNHAATKARIERLAETIGRIKEIHNLNEELADMGIASEQIGLCLLNRIKALEALQGKEEG